jgi:hypothetical protein
MLRFDSSPRRRTSYQFTIRRNPGGSWLAEESHGSLGASLSPESQSCASHCVKRTEMPIGSISNRLRRFWSTSRRSPASIRSMQLSLTFRYDGDGWLIRGLPRDPVGRFDDLAEALDYAKHECAAEPANIELFVDGLYIVTVVQERGWPRQLCRPTVSEVVIPAGSGGLRRASKIHRIAARLWRGVSSRANWLRLRQAAQPARHGSGGKLSLRR